MSETDYNKSPLTTKLRQRVGTQSKTYQPGSSFHGSVSASSRSWVPSMTMPSNTARTLRSLISSQTVLFNVPILIVVIVASLDNADKQLLASSFAVLEKTLNLDVKLLGYFSMFTNLSYALSLPLWGFLVHKYGMERIHILLSFACCSWGLATVGIAAAGSSIMSQAILRALNGIALGSILPLSQTILVDLVEVSMRGRAFGFMGLCEKLAGTLAASSIVYFENWQKPYYILGIFSVLMGLVTRYTLTEEARRRSKLHHDKADLDENRSSVQTKDVAPKLTLWQIVQRIARIPAFMCLVAQGVFGGTPWDMMSFLLLLLDWRGFTKEQIVSIQFTSGASSTLGGWIGGMLGDYANERFSTRGRIMVAIVSVVGGIPLYALFLFAREYTWALLWINAFNILATWTPPAALRPVCADLTRNPSERAQIISMWIVLEKASGAIFGAPLVGYLTAAMLPQRDVENPSGFSAEKANALALSLCALSSLFWSLCAIFWVLMAYTWRNHQNKIIASTSSETVELIPVV